MAGQGRKEFSDGEVLSAADVNGYLMDQSVMRFADSSARTAAIGTPTEGMVTYLDDVNQIEVYDGTAWVDQQAPILSEGTAGQYLQSNGTAGSQWVNLEIADDIITTEGDLIVGGAGGDAERLGIGAIDTVLTSDGTSISWAAAAAGGGGGGEIFYTATANTIAVYEDDLSSLLEYSFEFISGGGSNNTVLLYDASDSLVNSFTNNLTFTPTADVVRVEISNLSESEILVKRSNPVLAEDGSVRDIIEITSTQSITLATSYEAFLIGGGGGGGGTSAEEAAGGGGGSGFISLGTVSAGTYTATIGAGGAGGGTDGTNGSNGGQTSIATLSANGGDGGSGAVSQGFAGPGGNGGSGGAGGNASTGGSVGNIPKGGVLGDDGDNGFSSGGSPGLGGNGQGGTYNETIYTYSSTKLAQDAPTFAMEGGGVFGGGNGGDVQDFGTGDGTNGSIGGGGGGAQADTKTDTGNFGGDGGNGLIVLLEVL